MSSSTDFGNIDLSNKGNKPYNSSLQFTSKTERLILNLFPSELIVKLLEKTIYPEVFRVLENVILRCFEDESELDNGITILEQLMIISCSP